MTRNGVNPRSTIEILAQDCLDVRELYKAGALDGEWVTFRWPEFRWPAVRKMRAGRAGITAPAPRRPWPPYPHLPDKAGSRRRDRSQR